MIRRPLAHGIGGSGVLIALGLAVLAWLPFLAVIWMAVR